VNQTAQLIIMSNIKNQRPCKNQNVFNFIKTFVNNFRFITKCKVNQQQNHQGMKIWRNLIIPSLKGFDFKMRGHFLWFEIFITKVLV